MNIFRLFMTGFLPGKILSTRKEKFWKFIILFIIMFLAGVLPFSFRIYQYGGFKNEFIKTTFKEYPPTFLPNEVKISKTGCYTESEITSQITIGDLTFIFGYDKEFNKKDFNTKNIIFSKKNKSIIYTDGKGYIIGNYNSFEKEYDFQSFNVFNSEEKKLFLNNFSDNLENSFRSYKIFYSLVIYTFTQLFMYIALFLILAFLLRFFKYGYSDYLNFKERLKVLVICMIYPSIISFIIGFLTHAFQPIILQFGIAIISVYVIMKYGKNEFNYTYMNNKKNTENQQ